MLRKLLSAILITAVLSGNSLAQDWVKKMQDPTVNFYDVQKSFNDYWKKEEKKEKFKSFFTFRNKTEKENEGYVMYKRWEHYIEPRVAPSGDRSLIHQGNEELQKIITDHTYKNARLIGGDWSPMGAFGVPGGGGGAGRLNCITFHPTNPDIIFVGAPAGGLWKTTDGGTTWSTTTDQLPTLGVSDIAINPVNPDIMYMGTGDVDAGDTYGIGVLKSIDAGVTWNITGLNWNISQGRDANRILISPNDENLIFAGTSTGIFRSADAGVSWTKVLNTAGIKDMEFKPGDASVIYAASATVLYKSVNSGISFTAVPTSAGLLASTQVNRIAIAVTPADAGYVYVLYSSSSDSDFKGLYLSTNSASTFSLQSNSPNLLGYDWDGSGGGGNGWYTLSLAVSPQDANEVMVGGVNIWKSSDAGNNWNCVAHWYGGGGLPYVHADIHNLIYRPDGSEFFAACDGGIYKTMNGGNSWVDKSAGLQIGEMYRLGNSVTDANVVIQGWQDNGCNMHNAGVFERVLGGDGMECFIDWSDPNYVYGEYQNGGLQGSTDGGASFNDLVNNITETGEWITPWLQDPVTPTTLYAGFYNVWKSTNRGNSWTPISSFNVGLTIVEVAKSNPLYIYAANSFVIYKTTDGGLNWTTITDPAGNTITSLEISATDPEKIWMTHSGYTANDKVYKSLDGGLNWTNISASLPNIPINCIESQTGTNDGVYIGTDLGVYYTDNDFTSWMPFSNGLPNVVVDELEIHYGAGKLRAATFGRGLWETSIHDPLSNLPYANFTGDTLSGCPGFDVQYSDSTTNSPTAWSWRFPGGTPAASTLQNPVVTYNTPGMYHNVTLVVTNALGIDSVTKYSYVAVSPQTTPLISLNKNDTICQGQSVTLFSSNGNSFQWHPFNQVSFSINVFASDTFAVTVTDVFGCKLTSDSVAIYVAPLPATPVITLSNDTLFSSYASGNQWYNNGVLITGATDSLYVLPTWGLNITVRYTDSLTGCYATSPTFVGVDELGTNGISYSVFPNPGNGMVNLVFQSDLTGDVDVEITDMVGRRVYNKNYDSFKGRQESRIDLTAFGKGIYLLSLKNAKGIVSKKVVVY